MKSKLQNIWENLTTGGFAAVGCTLMLAIVGGGLWSVTMLFRWIWTFNWVKTTIYSIGYFITENSQLLEYIFVGGFLLYLFGCIVFGLVNILQDNKVKIVYIAKIVWTLFLKILAILAILAICLFSLHECFHNSTDIEPQLYEHRM